MKTFCLIFLMSWTADCLCQEPPVVESAKAAADLDKLFHRTDGWIGADGVYSVMLSNKKTAWLFSDTWIGKVRDGRRTEATIVNNSIGIHHGPTGPIDYTVGKSIAGKPEALIMPMDKRGWFWLQAGVADQDRLTIFLNQVEKTDDESVFGFRSIGLWLAHVTDTNKSPDQWHVEQTKMRNVDFTSNRILTWGAAVLSVDSDLYVYGTDETTGKVDPHRQMVVARVPLASVGDFSQWRYFFEGKWHEDFRHPTHLVPDMASEYSVTPFGNRYLAVYTEKGLSPRILGRFADNPWGPWSAPSILYECPEMGRDNKLFCYSAKAHPSMSVGNEIVLSYVVNSFDFWQVAKDAHLYWPRFVRVSLVPEK